MRFSSYSDEESCDKGVVRRGLSLACLRTKGHDGECEPVMYKAGDADGVRWCCRVKLECSHEDWCPLLQGDAGVEDR